MKEDAEKTFSINYEITDIIQLYRAYMPYVIDGAIFVPNVDEEVNLGDHVTATIKLPEDQNPLSFTGKVVWISPKKLLSEESKAGIGIKIEGENAKEIRTQIEDLIKDYLNSDQPTDTM